MKAALWILVLALAGYSLLGALMYFGQRRLMYFPETLRTPPALAGLPEAEEVVLDTGDGERVIAWHVPPRGDKPTVLYFHGNGGSLRYRAIRFAALVADGTGLVALSYRGFGGSSGKPDEAGLIADAVAAYRYAVARTAPDRLVLWGESIGSAVAIALAAQHPVGGLILEAPFTSAADVGQRAYWFMPVHLLIRDSFHSDWRIGRVTAPVLLMHGDADRVVPIAFGERLYTLINSRKHFARFSGGGHNDLDSFGAFAAVRGFLAGRIP